MMQHSTRFDPAAALSDATLALLRAELTALGTILPGLYALATTGPLGMPTDGADASEDADLFDSVPV